MTDADRNSKLDDSIILKRIKSRYININEDIIHALTPFTLKLYLIFRFESDYSQECSSLKRNIKFFLNKSGLSRSQCFVSMKELEKHGLLKRVHNEGYQSTYWIASDLNYFSPKDEEQPDKNLESTEIDQNPVQQMDYPVQHVDYPVQQLDTIFTNSSTITNHKISNNVDFDKSTSYREDNLFMQFYSLYPNKQKPEIARKAFYQHKPTQDFVDMLCNDLLQRMNNNWKNRHKSKIPHPATYLNHKEWEGEIYEPESTSSSGKEDALSRVIKKHINKSGNVYEHGTSNTFDPFR